METICALKAFVEQTVRPIHAHEALKMKMRKELYAHLAQTYQTEFAADRSEQLAIERTLRRMGPQADLRRELQASVPLRSRWAGRYDQLVRGRDGMSPLRHAARLTTVFTVLQTVVVLCALSFQFGELVHWTAKAAFMTRFALSQTLWFSLNLFALTLVVDTVNPIVQRRFSRRHDWMWASALFLAAAANICAAGWLFLFTATGDAALATAHLWRWGTLALLFAPGMYVVAWLDIAERRELNEWLALDLHAATVEE